MPSPSAIAPYPLGNAKIGKIFLSANFLSNCSKIAVKNTCKTARLKAESLHIKQETLQILPFRMVDVHRVVRRLVQPVQNPYAASRLSSR